MKKNRKQIDQVINKWTTDQDIYLIENSELDLSKLSERLPFSAEEIIKRKEVLGLIRRSWQMRRLN